MQRNMAANCGMDFRAAGEFVASIALGELEALEASGALVAPEVEADSQGGACRGVEAQGNRMMPQPDEGSQGVRNILLHSRQCQTRQPLADDKLDRDKRTILAAELKLRQALPMLEGLLSKVRREDGYCSSPASTVRDQDTASSTTCERSEKNFPDVSNRPPGAVKRVREAVPLSEFSRQWRGMDDGSFWQALQRLALDIKARFIDGKTPRLG